MNVTVNCEQCLESYYVDYEPKSQEFLTDHTCPDCGAEPDDGMLANAISNALADENDRLEEVAYLNYIER